MPNDDRPEPCPNLRVTELPPHRAAVTGQNPLWAAVQGAWSSGTVKIRVVMVLLSVAVLLTAVVAVVALLLTLLIEAVGTAIRTLAT